MCREVGEPCRPLRRRASRRRRSGSCRFRRRRKDGRRRSDFSRGPEVYGISRRECSRRVSRRQVSVCRGRKGSPPPGKRCTPSGGAGVSASSTGSRGRTDNRPGRRSGRGRAARSTRRLEFPPCSSWGHDGKSRPRPGAARAEHRAATTRGSTRAESARSRWSKATCRGAPAVRLRRNRRP